MLKWLEMIFHKKHNPCDGCDRAWMTKGISCDHCYNGSLYRKASEEEIKQYWNDTYKED